MHWSLLTPAILKIKKPGGLSAGYHDVTVQFGYSTSYMPPSMEDPELGIIAFGPTVFNKKMIIV